MQEYYQNYVSGKIKWGASSRWSSSLYCPGIRTIGRTHPALVVRCSKVNSGEPFDNDKSVMSSDLSCDLPGSRLSLEILKEISQVPRFKTSLFFLLDSEKEIIKKLFDELATQVTIPPNLKSSFLV